METRNCPACNAVNRSGAPYCMRCGKPMPPEQTAASRHARAFAARATTSPMFQPFPEAFDFSPESLARLDALMNELFGTGGQAPGRADWQPQGPTWQAVVDFGAYLGEVLCAALPGRWQMHPQHPEAVIQARVIDPQGRNINPFAQMGVRFRDGGEVGMASMYAALTGQVLPVWQIPDREPDPAPMQVDAVPGMTPDVRESVASDADPEARLKSAQHHLERGHLGMSQHSLRTLVGSEELTHAQRLELVSLLVGSSLHEEAVGELDRLRSSFPEDDTLTDQRAVILAHLGRMDEAIGSLELALKRHPAQPVLQRRLAFLLLKAGRFQPALRAMIDVLKLQRNDGEALLGAAFACERLGLARESRGFLEAACKPEITTAIQEVARTRLAEQAAQSKAAPPAPVSLPLDEAARSYGLALEAARAGRFADALPWFERAAQLVPQRASYAKDVGNCLKDLNRPAEARIWLERALKLEPGYTVASYLLGQCDELEGRIDSAVRRYRDILANQASEPPWVDRAFDRLKALKMV